jgi:hypothetical protein
MFSLLASRAIALSKANREPPKPRAHALRSAAPRAGKGFFSRVFDALVESRMRQAEIRSSITVACAKRRRQNYRSEDTGASSAWR